MEYKIDIEKGKICVKNKKGYYASSEEYTSFFEAFKIFAEPLNQPTSKDELIFTEVAKNFFDREQRRNLRNIVVPSFD
jgi:hypothetical protein